MRDVDDDICGSLERLTDSAGGTPRADVLWSDLVARRRRRRTRNGALAALPLVLVAVLGAGVFAAQRPDSGHSDVAAGDGESEVLDEAPTGESDVELAASGACGDAYFWAATVTGDIAVTLMVDARERAVDETTTIPISLPDPAITVEVLRGEKLATNFCTDEINMAFEPSTRQPATGGEGEVLLEPSTTSDPLSCGGTVGTLRLAGLVAEDGTTFAPVEVSSRSIGCEAAGAGRE